MGIFKPAWKSKDHLKREKAVAGLEDQAILAEIAQNDENVFVRQAAIKKLADRAVLASLMRTEQNRHALQTIRERLEEVEAPLKAQQHDRLMEEAMRTDDQQALSGMLESAYRIEEKLLIIGRMTDQKALMEALRNDRCHLGDQRVKQALVEKIDDPALKLEIVCGFGDEDEETIRQVLEETADLWDYMEILKNAASYSVRHMALEKITDERELMRALDALKREMGAASVSEQRKRAIRTLQEAVVKKITDPALLEAIAFGGAKNIRLAAIEKIENNDTLCALMEKSDDQAIRRAALAGIDGQEVLRTLLRSEPDAGLQMEIMGRIADAALLWDIAKGNDDAAVRKEAAARLARTPGFGREEMDALAAYALEHLGALALFDIVPEAYHTRYGLRYEVTMMDMRDQYGGYSQRRIEYFHKGEPVGTVVR